MRPHLCTFCSGNQALGFPIKVLFWSLYHRAKPKLRHPCNR